LLELSLVGCKFKIFLGRRAYNQFWSTYQVF
jgi:hypothetical protein